MHMHRLNLNKIVPAILIGIFLLFAVPSGMWAQNLQIHYINVQQGGSTLIIGPNGTVILYDGGYEFKGTNEVIPYLQSVGITTTTPINYIIASHRDTDHFVGLTEVMNGGYDALNVYDNGSDKTNTYVDAFLTAAAGTTAGGVTPMPLGQVIDLGNGAKATCVAVNGYVLGSGLIPNGQNNENDRSIALLVEYGDFDFLIHGDMGGGSDDGACTGRSTSQINLETPMVQSIMPGGTNPLLSAYGVEVAHIAHHGSESSGNADYMNALSPSVAIVCVGAGQSASWHHPRKDVIESVFLAGVPCIYVPAALVLQTEEGSPTGEKTSFAGYCAGDIVITTDGVNSYTVSATGAVSQGPDERTAAGLPRTYYFDEHLALDSPPVLLNIKEQNLASTSVDISWTTNEPAVSRVKYGTAAGTYPSVVDNATQQLSHSFSVTGLTSGTTYYYVVESTDATGNTTTSLEASFTTTGGSTGGSVVFSEVYYDTIGTDADEEWIEIYNGTDASVDLSGWLIVDNNDTGASYTIPAGTTIKAGTYLTIAADSAGFNALYGYDADVYGSIPGLNNGGDVLHLKDSTGTVIDFVAWEGGASAGIPAGWGSTSDPWAGTGNTIVRSDPNVDTDTASDWGYATNNGNPQVQPAGSIVFSEVYYDTIGDDNTEEWIEFYNNGKDTVDLGNWTIVDNNGTGFTYTFPAGVTVAPGTYLTVARESAGFTALYSYEADLYGNLPFLNNGGDTLLLKNASGDLIDTVAWEGGASSGTPDGWGSTSDPWASTGNTIVRTDVTADTDTYEDWGYATDNGNPQTQTPSTPKVVFSEVFYDTPGTDADEEWIEFYNNSGKTVDLSDWTITDNNDTGSSYTFPSGTSMKPNSYLTVAMTQAGFNALYGYDADLYGSLPFLNNSGDTLILKNAAGDVIDFVAWEGGASAGIPDGWGSTSNPWASTGNTIVRGDDTVDTDTYADWTYATNGGNPQTQVSPGNILFSEVYYDTVGDDAVEEWFELYNNSTFAVNIGGWTVTDNNGTGATYTFPEGTTIEPGTFYTVAANSAGFQALYQYNADLYGAIPQLNNSGDTLILKDSAGNVKDFVAWEGGASSGIPDGWGSTSNPWASTGNTIVRTDYTVDTDTYADWSYDTANGHPQNQDMGVPDTAPPVLSDIVSDSIGMSSATIKWTTNEPADTVVQYGTATGTYTDIVEIADFVTEHEVVLQGIAPLTTYYYTVKSTDEAGNPVESSEYSFTTLVSEGLSQYAVFATNSVHVRTLAEVNSGNIGVVDASAGPWLSCNSEIAIGIKAKLADGVDVYGDDVNVKIGASVDDVFCNQFNGSGEVRGQLTTPLQLPLNVSFPLLPASNPGTEKISVGIKKTLTLEPGSYGKVDLKPYATLILSGGTYQLESLDLGIKSKIHFQAPTILVIANHLKPGSFSEIAPQAGASVTAKDMVIYVHAQNGETGNLWSLPPAVSFGIRSTVNANVFAPNGTIWLMPGCTARGAFIARDVIVGIGAKTSIDNYFD